MIPELMQKVLDLVVGVVSYAGTSSTVAAKMVAEGAIEFRPYYDVHSCDQEHYFIGPVFSWEPGF